MVGPPIISENNACDLHDQARIDNQIYVAFKKQDEIWGQQ
jgi:hypothetical protein